MHLPIFSFSLLLLLGMTFTESPKIFAEPGTKVNSRRDLIIPGESFIWVAGDTAERKFITSDRLYLGTQKNFSASIRIGDLDGDTHPDIVVANGRHWPQQNFVFFNQGRSQFKRVRPLGQDLVASYATELADLDNDGDLDIAVGNDTTPNAIFLNDGHGHFQHHGSFGDPSSIRSLKLVDINQDGSVDILANARGKQNLIYLNNGAAKFPTSRTFGNTFDSTIDVAVADLNQDGQLDLILANRDNQPNVVLINDGRTHFNQRLPFGSGRDETRAVEVADLNGDGKLDWITGNIGQPNTIYLGNGKGGVSKILNFGREDGRTYALAIADMDQNDRPDIIVGNVAQPNAVFLNQKDDLELTEVRFGDPANATYNLAIGDLNQDGYPEIAVANSNSQNLIYLNLPVTR